ncbi:hypothetical protein OSB04_001140 [Centaurea solstitialis]|uniref:Uncharacterized protein n=1 Tax=Centaurea solstitialis TaxID=347529 RepID=A0AA38WU97_9ASTR|nr:hypothetical protein OSB04_001140 [Centaurea solstitialis]
MTLVTLDTSLFHDTNAKDGMVRREIVRQILQVRILAPRGTISRPCGVARRDQSGSDKDRGHDELEVANEPVRNKKLSRLSGLLPKVHSRFLEDRFVAYGANEEERQVSMDRQTRRGLSNAQEEVMSSTNFVATGRDGGLCGI